MLRTSAIAGAVAIGLLSCSSEADNEIANAAARALGPRQTLNLHDNDPRCAEGTEGPGNVWTSVLNDERTAIGIAERYFAANFPEMIPSGICHLEARLSHGVWHVGGVLPPNTIGGCLNIEICQRSGRVLRMWGEQQ